MMRLIKESYYRVMSFSQKSDPCVLWIIIP